MKAETGATPASPRGRGRAEQDSRFESELLTPAFFTDPYPVLERMRAQEPVYWSDAMESWVLTRHADNIATLRDPRLFSNAGRMTALMNQLPPAISATMGPFKSHFAHGLLHADPPDHTRMRALVNQAFSPRVVEDMRPRIQALTDSLIDKVAAEGRMDVIKDLAYPLPALVISVILGLPLEDIERFKAWSDDMMAVFATSKAEAATAARGQRSLLEMRAYFSERIAERRRALGDDLLSRLVAAEEEGTSLSEPELLSTIVLLLVAGHETTTNLIGNTVLALLRHPEPLAAVRTDPALLGGAIEESLRYDSPLFRLFRVATCDLELGGRRIAKGDMVSQMVGAANRDPEVFSDPDRFDLRRKTAKHIAFGSGVHFCVGAPLARLEAPVAVGTLLRRFPGLRLADEAIAWQPTVTLRGVKALRVEWG